MVYSTDDLCESGKFGIPVSCKRCREARRCLREAGRAIVAVDCHLVRHAMQNCPPSASRAFISCRTSIHLSVLIIIISTARRYLHTVNKEGKFVFHS